MQCRAAGSNPEHPRHRWGDLPLRQTYPS
uniref:Uncharacterized protein n=1 Tax=Arundo donax TaxID=35708 RepID=A0A0A8ZVA3_ARUDO